MRSFVLSKKCLSADVILDARMIQHSGIGTYLRGLLTGFEHHPFFQKRRLGLALKDSNFSEVKGFGSLVPFGAPIYSLQEQIEYPFQLSRSRLWHAPHYNIPFVKTRTRLVVTIHDLIHWLFRKDFYSPIQALYSKIFFERAVRVADRIIAVSNQTREDLIRHFKAPEKKIVVVYEGVRPEFFEPPARDIQLSVLKKYGLSEPFYLYVGLLKPHKNILRLVEVFKKLRAAGQIQSHLVLVGKKDQRYSKPFSKIGEIKTADGIHYVGRVASHEELACLYTSARALLHPSLYEGFGLTCLEAMASGLPVVVSRAASLPEVVGDAGYYVDPHSEASIRQGILAVEENESLRKNLSEKGRIRARQFSWSRTADETLRIYEELLS